MVVGLAPTADMRRISTFCWRCRPLTLTFSSSFIAEDAGFYKKEGLSLDPDAGRRGLAHAVIAVSADFLLIESGRPRR